MEALATELLFDNRVVRWIADSAGSFFHESHLLSLTAIAADRSTKA